MAYCHVSLALIVHLSNTPHDMVHNTCPLQARGVRILDSARKGGRFCLKSSEIGTTIQTLWRAIPRILLHFFIHIPNMHGTYQKKYRILPIFLPASSAKAHYRPRLQAYRPRLAAPYQYPPVVYGGVRWCTVKAEIFGGVIFSVFSNIGGSVEGNFR